VAQTGKLFMTFILLFSMRMLHFFLLIVFLMLLKMCHHLHLVLYLCSVQCKYYFVNLCEHAGVLILCLYRGLYENAHISCCLSQCTIRQQPHARSMRANTWDGDGDEVLEEEARLFGMPPLEAHNSLEDAMHPHQLEGFKFLSKNLVEQDSGGCMLAFAPGTGKSFLIISFIHSFMRQVPNARPMIVAPKSMIRPWIQEFKKWQVEETTLFNLYEGVDDAAKVEILKLWQETRSVLLVGYAQCTNMSGEIGRYLKEGPGLMVLDEGHLARTETTKILKSLSRVHTKRRVLLSGTPFNNNFQEFYTTLELVRPNFMQRANVEMQPTLNALMPPEPKASEKVSPFLKRFSNAGRQAFKDAIGENLFESGKHHSITRALGQLRKLIEPFVAWHKGQILKTLPGITDLTIMLELTSKQRELLKNDNSEVRDNLQKRAAAIYLHPIVEPVSDGGKRSQNDPRLRGDNIDLKQGVKLRWVLDLVQLCDAAKEKVLIFSEYLYALELIENVAMHRMKWSKGSQILRIDGKMDIADRETSINKFNNDQDAKMMCASIKACGEGICLVGASRVVILEVVWNPSVTRQAISRAFRIGQQKKVVVYRLIAADTYEEHRMHATATRKEWLSKLLFDPSISCVDPNSILRDVTKDCNDMFLDRGPLRNGVKSIYEREFCG
jgi:DNA repair and recombination RAD54-like protein